VRPFLKNGLFKNAVYICCIFVDYCSTAQNVLADLFLCTAARAYLGKFFVMAGVVGKASRLRKISKKRDQRPNSLSLTGGYSRLWQRVVDCHAGQHSLAGRYDIQCQSRLYSPSQGLRIWLLVLCVHHLRTTRRKWSLGLECCFVAVGVQ
jgi:hypothetical protein